MAGPLISLRVRHISKRHKAKRQLRNDELSREFSISNETNFAHLRDNTILNQIFNEYKVEKSSMQFFRR